MRCLLVIFCFVVSLCTLLVRAHPAATSTTTGSAAAAAEDSALVSKGPSEDSGALSAVVAASPDPANLPPDTFRKLAQALYDRGEKQENRMQRKFLYNPNATCNDGSAAGYYMRRNYNSKRWVVFLEGGWICHDVQSCLDRSAREHPRTSSDRWPSNKTVGGILSADPAENPHFADANHVFVPYCSSDSWSGTRRGSFSKRGPGGNNNSPAFLGSLILREVIKELAGFEQLQFADELYLAGSSAGGTGVLVNVDSVAEMLSRFGVRVRGIVDSGWFLDNDPFSSDCNEGLGKCSVIQNLKRGVELWKAQVPRQCHVAFPGEIWKCFLGYRIFPLIKTPLFIFQWQFDKFQLYADNVAVPASRDQWNYIHRMGKNLRGTLNNASFVFSPACIAHEVLTNRHWSEISVNDVTLPEALLCWTQSLPGAGEKRLEGGSNNNNGGLEVRSQLAESFAPREGNEIMVPLEMNSRTASMLSDSPHSYKPVGNLLRSISTNQKDKSRNSINKHFEASGRRSSNFDDNRNDNGHGGRQRHGKGRRNREDLRRGKRGKRKQKNQKCQTESNSCHDEGTNDEDNEEEEESYSSNSDLLRSLDTRSSKKKRNGKLQNKNKGEGKDNAEAQRVRKHDGGEKDNSAKETRRAERRRQRRLRKKRLRAQRRRERKRLRELEKQGKLSGDDKGSDRTLSEVGGDSGEEKRQSDPHHLKVRSVDILVHSSPSQSASSSSSSLSSQESSSAARSQGGPKCQAQLIDSCSWPHCNPSCPKLKNPETGQEIDFLTLLKSFGLDMGSVARAMGVDIATLNNMDREVLLHLLTSQSQN